MNNTLNLSSGPHIRDRWTTPFIMGCVLLALLPTAVVGVVVNGLHALWVILVCMLTCFLTELLFDKFCHRPNTFLDGSALVTGLLLALCLSPTVPLYIPIIGGIFAILVVKCCFGGLGKNFINPALAARCFLLISFGNTMTKFPAVDGVTGATPVAELLSGKAVDVTRMFLGTTNGVIGSSVLAMLVGGLLLWAFDIIHGEICFSVLIGFTVFMGLFGGQGFDPAYLAANICGGGVVMAAFFMATDYVTSPVSRLGQLTYGLLIGILGGLLRVFGTSADSFSYCVIIGNLFTPLIDTYVVPKPFAFRKREIEMRAGTRQSFRIPKPVIALTVITLLAGLALSGAYTVTKPNIDAQKEAARAEAYRIVIPEAEEFEFLTKEVEALGGGTYGTSFGKVKINEAVVGKAADGSIAGYAVSVTSSEGYEGDITLSLGVKPDGTVNGITYTELNETPGKGSLCGEPAFMDQFSGRNVAKFILLKDGGASQETEIDGVSGATWSSKASVNAVNAGLDFLSQIRGE